MAYELMIRNGETMYFPATEEGVVWTTERKGVPGKLTFTVVQDKALSFTEGNHVRFKLDDHNIFYGFVFTKQRTGDRLIQVTAYDQLRYLKNKDTISKVGIKASELLQILAADFNLQCGEVEDTEYVIDSIVEEDQALFDIVQGALDDTLQATGKLYCLYDDFGKMTLKSLGSMRSQVLIDIETFENLEYISSIDEQTYNKIKLTYDNENTGKRDVYISQDGSHINDWGVLQYHEAVQTETGIVAKANALLKLYNQKTRKLTLKNVLGDPSIRAGTLVMVRLQLEDVELQNYMLVEKVNHVFKESEHLMDLTLVGGEFIA